MAQNTSQKTPKTSQKTHAIAADRSRKMSGWTSDKMLYSTVPARTILDSTGFPFAKHNFDERGVRGSYYASHVEPQALYNAREDAAILVSRPMCNSCREFVPYLARQKNITVHIGTPEGIVIVSRSGSMKTTDSANGTTSAGIQWSMRHEKGAGRTSMRLIHPNLLDRRLGGHTEISVSGNSKDPDGPVAMENHTYGDGVTEKSTYFENKEVDIQVVTNAIEGQDYSASTRVGTSGGVRDSLTKDGVTEGPKLVPKKFLGLRR